ASLFSVAGTLLKFHLPTSITWFPTCAIGQAAAKSPSRNLFERRNFYLFLGYCSLNLRSTWSVLMPAHRKALALLGPLLLTFAVVLTAKETKKAAQIPEDKQIIHALNRFTFGARPGDVERVKAEGLDKWFEEQLHPERINDSALEARLGPLRTLQMSTSEIIRDFPPNQVLKAVENGRMSMPRDPAKHAIYESRIEAMEQKKVKKQDAGAGSGQTATSDEEQMKPADRTNPPANLKLDVDDNGTTPDAGKQQEQKQLEDAMYTDLQGKPQNKKIARDETPTT